MSPAVDIVGEGEFDGLIGRRQGIGVPAVAFQMSLGNAQFGPLGLGVANHADLVGLKGNAHGVEIRNHGLCRATGIGFSLLMTFRDLQMVPFEQIRKGFGPIGHHGLEPHDLLGHIGSDDGGDGRLPDSFRQSFPVAARGAHDKGEVVAAVEIGIGVDRGGVG